MGVRIHVYALHVSSPLSLSVLPHLLHTNTQNHQLPTPAKPSSRSLISASPTNCRKKKTRKPPAGRICRARETVSENARPHSRTAAASRQLSVSACAPAVRHNDVPSKYNGMSVFVLAGWQRGAQGVRLASLTHGDGEGRTERTGRSPTHARWSDESRRGRLEGV